jgi:hypothetical protein
MTAATVTKLRTRRPTGKPSWPLILLAGEAKTGKTFAAAQFSGDPRIGRTLWMDLGEGCADEYGSVPGADYEIVEHDGTWIDIVEQAAAVKEVAQAEQDAGNPPVLFVLDSMTAEWAMLTSWTNDRAKRSKNNRKLLAENPDAEIDVSSNYWNDANSRHNRLMNILKTFPGIVVMTSLETEKTQIGPGGRPIENAPKVAKPDAQKRLPADASVWIRLSLTEAPTIVGIRSVKFTIRGGIDKPKPWADFSLGALVFERMGIDAGSAQARNMPALDAHQVAPGEEPEVTVVPDQRQAAKPTALREPTPARAGTPSRPTDARQQEQRAARLDDAQKAAKGVDALLAAANADAAEALVKIAEGSSASGLDVTGLLSDGAKFELHIGGDYDVKAVSLVELAAEVFGYVLENNYSVNTGIAVTEAAAAEQSIGEAEVAPATDAVAAVAAAKAAA